MDVDAGMAEMVGKEEEWGAWMGSALCGAIYTCRVEHHSLAFPLGTVVSLALVGAFSSAAAAFVSGAASEYSLFSSVAFSFLGPRNNHHTNVHMARPDVR